MANFQFLFCDCVARTLDADRAISRRYFETITLARGVIKVELRGTDSACVPRFIRASRAHSSLNSQIMANGLLAIAYYERLSLANAEIPVIDFGTVYSHWSPRWPKLQAKGTKDKRHHCVCSELRTITTKCFGSLRGLIWHANGERCAYESIINKLPLHLFVLEQYDCNFVQDNNNAFVWMWKECFFQASALDSINFSIVIS